MQVINKPAADCRLFERELDYIVNHAKDQFLILDTTFIDIMLKLQHKLPSIKGFIILTDRKHMPSDCKLRNVMCYEDTLEVSLVTFCSQRCCCSRHSAQPFHAAFTAVPLAIAAALLTMLASCYRPRSATYHSGGMSKMRT